MVELAREQVVEYLKGISLMEASALVKDLEAAFGVSAAAPVMGMAMPGGAMPGAAAGAAPQEEKTEFDVILKACPADKKIPVIKVVRAATGLGLKEAKDLVEGAPKPVKTGISKDDAAKLKKELEENGAQVEVK